MKISDKNKEKRSITSSCSRILNLALWLNIIRHRAIASRGGGLQTSKPNKRQTRYSCDFNSGVEAVAADGRYVVTSLSGIVVLDTTNAADLDNLPRGIYIIGGKKVIVK